LLINKVGNPSYLLKKQYFWRYFFNMSKMSVSGNKNNKSKRHRVAFSISERDYEILRYYALVKKTSKSLIAKQLLHNELQRLKNDMGDLPIENQLNLFVAPQTDIFDFIDDKNQTNK